MYANKQINLHERSVAVLELIKEANRCIEECRNILYRYDNAGPFDMIQLMNTRQSIVIRRQRYEAIRDRLVCWYADIMQRLFEEAMFRIGKSKSVVEIAEEVLC